MVDLPSLLEGATVVAQSALALASVLATCLALAPMPAATNLRMALAFCACFLLSGLVAQPLPEDAVASCVLVLLGVPIATGIRLASWQAWLASCAAGFAAGIAGKMPTASFGESLGAVIPIFLFFAVLRLVLGIEPPRRLARVGTLARRMAGAWIAVVGVLMLALWMRSNVS